MLYASVRIINLPYSADKNYEYQIPLQLENKVKVGSIVLVPFGTSNKVQTALVTEVSDKKAYNKVKPVLSAPGKYLFVKKELLELCMYMSEKMLCSVGDAVKCVLPAGLGVQKSKIYEVKKRDEYTIPDEIQKSAAMNVLGFIESAGKVSGIEIENEFGTVASASLKRLEKIGALSVSEDYVCKISAKKEKFVKINNDKNVLEAIKSRQIKLTPKQADAYEILMNADSEMSLSELMELSGINSMSVIRELAIKGVVILYEIDKDRSVSVLTEFAHGEYGDFTLSEEQQSAYEKLYNLYLSNEPKAALLHGVTGSGKTNVILKLIDKVIESGKNVIVLVPEIALTSQTVGRFAARYKKDGIALIHSALSVGERIDAYKRISSGEAKIIIGTRSAVFAQTENIGLIVMDEEHESSFKSDKSPKYHARDIARFRCAYSSALLVMASATPSVESYYRAKSGRYELVELKNRYGTNLPEVEFYDMKDEPYFEMPDDEFDPFEEKAFEDIFETPAPCAQSNETSKEGALPVVIGKKLEEEIKNCLERKEQTILFINRRGYRAFALCRSCGNVFTCPNCSVSMTYHKLKRDNTGKMVCHYCGYTERIPEVCAKCGKPRISFVGSGTQLVEETLKRKFPEARILRMDADTTGGEVCPRKDFI